jgi:CheY-like chemotaxis protein
MTKKILVIDDDLTDLEAMKLVLEKEKYDVETADNGADALDILRTLNPSLILMDIRMPTFSGYDLLRLMSMGAGKNVKLVFVSVVPRKEVDMQGVDGFVQKPFTPMALINEVKRVMH